MGTKIMVTEIVPAHDLLLSEMEKIKGGANDVHCSQGCSSGSSTGKNQ